MKVCESIIFSLPNVPATGISETSLLALIITGLLFLSTASMILYTNSSCPTPFTTMASTFEALSISSTLG